MVKLHVLRWRNYPEIIQVPPPPICNRRGPYKSEMRVKAEQDKQRMEYLALKMRKGP